jgi:hypothetical protein
MSMTSISQREIANRSKVTGGTDSPAKRDHRGDREVEQAEQAMQQLESDG